MKLFNSIRSKGKLQSRHKIPEAVVYRSYSGSDAASKLEAKILCKIFAFICPHTRDDTYTTCEESMTEGGCMLCDMRDLAHCSLVCKSWTQESQRAL
ncbi:MAG: hypothetical protein LQ340_003621, partial [Diploschistes diacapsis]